MTTISVPISTQSRTALDRFAAAVSHVVPDAITASVILLLMLAAAALGFGHSGLEVMDAYYRGLWMLLPFTMQMTLIIVLSSSLSATPFFRRAVERLAAIPRTVNQTVFLSVLVSGTTSYFYWGLGIALGPLIAVHFAKEAERKGIAIDFPFFLATIYAGGALWQFGLSSTAPLLVATPGHFLESTIGVIPLSRTIWSPAAILQTGVYFAALVFMGCRFMPRGVRPISFYPESAQLATSTAVVETRTGTYSERLERLPYFAFLLSAIVVAWLWYHFAVKRASLDINSLNSSLLLFNLLLHGNFRRFTKALETSVVSGWPVIILYHLYAGLAGLIQFTRVGENVAGMAASISNTYTFPALTAWIASVFSFFIPSSGGQWAIQGFMTVKSALAVGVSAERGLLALGLGDHMGNLTSPFWYVVVAGIVRLDFRAFFGYGLLYAAVWFVIGVLVFTFAPC